MNLRPFEDADVTVLDQQYLVKINGNMFVATIVERRGALYFTDQDHYWLLDDAEEKYAILESELAPIHQVVEVLIAGVCEYHRNDPTAPSVVLSLLPNGKYYAAVHRFTGRYAEDRTIIAKAARPTLEETIEEVSREFMAAIGRGPALDALAAQARVSTEANKVLEQAPMVQSFTLHPIPTILPGQQLRIVGNRYEVLGDMGAIVNQGEVR